MRRLVTLVAGATLLAACGGGGSSDREVASKPKRSATTTTTTTTTTVPPPPTVSVADSPLGPILVDATGTTLYAFDNDSATSVACTGDCAGLWPPVTVTDAPVAGAGVDPAQLSTIDGPNGKQVTYAGHPLYRYSLDLAPGETKGHGIGGTWWVIGANGATLEPPPATAAPRGPQATTPAPAPAPAPAPEPPPPPPPPPPYPY